MIVTGEGVGPYKAGGQRRHPWGGDILETRKELTMEGPRVDDFLTEGPAKFKVSEG